MWQDIGPALSAEFADVRDLGMMTSLIVRLLAAAILGGVVGYEREVQHKSAGLRTHMLVAIGAALFVMAPPRALVNGAELGRIIQGIATGVGFIGAGAILKQNRQEHVKGLTTAAGIWLTAAIGVTVGAGHLGLAILATVVGMLVILVVGRYEHRLLGGEPGPSRHENSSQASDPRGNRAVANEGR